GRFRQAIEQAVIDHGARAFGGFLAVSQQADDAGLADAGRHFISGRTQPLGGDVRGTHLLQRQLRLGMQVLVNDSSSGSSPGRPASTLLTEAGEAMSALLWWAARASAQA